MMHRSKRWLAMLAVSGGMLFQTSSCTNNLDANAIRQITNVVTDSLFFILDNILVRASV